MMVSGSNFAAPPSHRDILVKAAMLRGRRSSIRLVDAAHFATAPALSCGFLVSHDRRLPTLEGTRMLAVNPFTLDDILGSKPS
jgi:hypothetical protein